MRYKEITKGGAKQMDYGSPFTPSITLVLEKSQVRRAINLMCDYTVDICMKIDKFNDKGMTTVAFIGEVETVTKFISSIYG